MLYAQIKVNEDGSVQYFQDAQKYREDIPARIHEDGRVEYHLDGNFYSKEDWEQELRNRSFK